MPLTQLEAELRLIARELMANGQLPQKAPSKMWGGPGTGRVCALCGKPIQPGEVELRCRGLAQSCLDMRGEPVRGSARPNTLPTWKPGAYMYLTASVAQSCVPCVPFRNSRLTIT
jgi:hypothetical protein